MAAITSDLELDYSQAVSDAESVLAPAIESALQTAADAFTVALQPVFDQVTSLQIQPDVSQLSSDVTSALASADVTVNPQVGDPAALGDEVKAAVDQNAVIEPQVDAAGIAGEVGGALESASADAPPIEPQVDVGPAESQITDLGSAASSAAGPTGSLNDALSQVGQGGKLAAGEIGGLSGILSTGSGLMAAEAGGAIALGAGIDKLAQSGIDATSAEQRFNDITQQLGVSMTSVHVGDLSQSLTKLGQDFGSTQAQMQNTVATLLQHGQAAGFASAQAQNYAEMMVAMGARAVALKPSLGDVSDVTDSMERAFARGGVRLAQYGISLDTASIKQEALNQTGKNSASDLTLQEKAYAGLTLATEKYGSNLSEVVAKGAENAANQQKSLRAEVENAIEAIGKPVAAPFLELMRDMIPIATSLGQILASLGESVLPAVASTAQVLAPVLGALATVVSTLAPVITPVVEGFLAFEAASTIIPMLGSLLTGLTLLAGELPVVGGAALAASEEINTASAAVEASAGPIGIVVAGIGLLAGALGIFGSSTSQADQNLQSFSDSLAKTGDLLDQDTQKALADAFAHEGLQHAFAQSGLTLSDLTGALANADTKTTDLLQSVTENTAVAGGWKEALAQVLPQIQAQDPALAEVISRLAEHGQLTDQNIAALTGFAGAAVTAAGASKDAAKTQSDANTVTSQSKDAFQQAADAAKAYKSALEELNFGHLSLFDAQTKIQSSTLQLTDSLAKAGPQFGQVTKEGVAQDQAVSSLAKDIMSYQDAVISSGGSQAQAAAAGQFLTQALQNQLQAAGVTGPALQALMAQLGPLTLSATGVAGGVNVAAASLSGLGLVAAAAAINVKALPAGLAQAAVEAGTQAQQIASRVQAGLLNLTPLTEGILRSELSTFQAGMSQVGSAGQQQGAQAGQQTGQGIQTGGQPAAEAAVQAIGNTVSINLAAIQGTAGSDAQGIGTSITSGITAGVNSGAGELSAAVTSVVNQALAAGRAAAGAHSPSLVMMQLGADLMEGLALGVSGTAPVAVASTQTAVSSVVATFDANKLADAVRAGIPTPGAPAGPQTTVLMVTGLEGVAPFVDAPTLSTLRGYLNGRR